MTDLKTTPEVAKHVGATMDQVRYAIREYDLEPTYIIGSAKVWNADGVSRIIAALKRTVDGFSPRRHRKP